MNKLLKTIFSKDGWQWGRFWERYTSGLLKNLTTAIIALAVLFTARMFF